MDDAGVDHYVSQQSNEQLADLAADIDPSATINGGVSADDRRDLFNQLSRGLSPENRQRWRAQLSEGLSREFDRSVSVFPDNEARSFLPAQQSRSAAGVADSATHTVTPERDLQSSSKEPAYVYRGDIDSGASAALISQLQARLSQLSVDLNKTDLHPGPVDGIWGELTVAGLRHFQEDQLGLLNTALQTLSDLPETRFAVLTEQKTALLIEMNLSKAGKATGALLATPYTATSMNSRVGEIREGSSALPVNATAQQLARFIDQHLHQPRHPAGGLQTVAHQSSPLDNSFAGQIRFVIAAIKERPSLLQEAVDQLDPGMLQLWADGISSLRPPEVHEFVELIARNLNAEQLNAFFNYMREDAQDALAKAIFTSGDSTLMQRFSERMLRQQLEQQPLSTEEQRSYMDLAQVTLDMVGIVDPTGLADVTGFILALGRGQIGSALLNVVGLLPWLGDLAKIGKLGSYVKYVDNAVNLATRNRAFNNQVAPLLIKVEEAAHSVKHSAVWDALSTKSQNHLDALLNKIDTLKLEGSTLPARVISGIGKTFGRNELTWGFDDLGRTTSVRGDIREIFSRSRSSRESSTTAIVGNSPDAGPHSVGGHIAAHRFTGEDTGLFNIVPQNGRRDPLSAADLKNLNQGAYAQFENEVSDWVTRGERLGKPVRVEFEVKLAYTGASKEPDRFRIVYKVVGDDGTVLFEPRAQDLLNQAGQIFNRTTPVTIGEILNRS